MIIEKTVEKLSFVLGLWGLHAWMHVLRVSNSYTDMRETNEQPKDLHYNIVPFNLEVILLHTPQQSKWESESKTENRSVVHTMIVFLKDKFSIMLLWDKLPIKLSIL